MLSQQLRRGLTGVVCMKGDSDAVASITRHIPGCLQLASGVGAPGQGEREPAKTTSGEIGILKEVRCHRDRPGRIYLTVDHGGADYVGCISFKNTGLCEVSLRICGAATAWRSAMLAIRNCRDWSGMKAPFFKDSFDRYSLAKKAAWLILTMFTFLIFFYSGTFLMSILYPLDEALLAF